MADRLTIRERLAWPFDVPTLRRIERLWVRHSIAFPDNAFAPTVPLQVVIHFPWDPAVRLFAGERISFDRGELAAPG